MGDVKAPEAAGEEKAPEAAGVEAIDYKAKYEEALAHSRKWEARAKENSKAAEDLKEAKAALEEANAKASAAEAKEERAKWVADAAKETGVPAEVVAAFAAESAEDLMAKAQGVAQLFKKDVIPVVPGDGKSAGKVKPGDMEEFVNKLFGN